MMKGVHWKYNIISTTGIVLILLRNYCFVNTNYNRMSPFFIHEQLLSCP